MTFHLRRVSASLEESEHLAGQFASILQRGDVIALRGSLGAGKTAFARAVINSLAPPGQAIEIPSPSFPLVFFYDFPDIRVAHFDFYRIKDPLELEDIGFHEALQTCLLLIEWPEHAEESLPEHRLDILIQLDSEDRRIFSIGGRGHWAVRLRHLEDECRFLASAGWEKAEGQILKGDASGRRFRRLCQGSQTVVFMDTSKEAGTRGQHSREGQDGQTGAYERSVRLSEGPCVFIAIAQLLRMKGFAAPKILHADLSRSFLLVEDFGDGGIVTGERQEPVMDRYRICVDVLLRIAQCSWPRAVPLENGSRHRIPVFDESVFLAEARLFTHWFAPAFLPDPLTAEAHSAFHDVWLGLFFHSREGPETLALRDFHSPNVIWRSDQQGLQKVGLIDFQDAIFAHPAYDLVSLLQDARADIPVSWERMLLTYYLENSASPLSETSFRSAYALLGAQRHCRLLGLFVRLSVLGGTDRYLSHLPRAASYLLRHLAQDQMAPLRDWFEQYAPVIFEPDHLFSASRLQGRFCSIPGHHSSFPYPY